MPRHSEFMHQNYESMRDVDRYFEVQEQRRIYRMSRQRIPSTNPLFSECFVHQPITRNERNGHHPAFQRDITNGGIYGRLNDCIVVHTEARTLIEIIETSMNQESLRRAGSHISRAWRHARGNIMRNDEVCNINSEWSIVALEDYGVDSIHMFMICLGCGISGDLLAARTSGVPPTLRTTPTDYVPLSERVEVAPEVVPPLTEYGSFTIGRSPTGTFTTSTHITTSIWDRIWGTPPVA
jgi:hypothetical protein